MSQLRLGRHFQLLWISSQMNESEFIVVCVKSLHYAAITHHAKQLFTPRMKQMCKLVIQRL